MHDIIALLGLNFLVILASMLLLWLISIPLKDVSFVDSFWAIGMIIVAAVTFATADGHPDRQAVLLVITTVWGLRLGLHLFVRWRHEGADGRYVALIAKAPGNPHVHTLKKVFLLQAVVLWFVSMPVQLGQVGREDSGLGLLAYLGIALAAIGFFFESVGDFQLRAFKADPANKGKVMDRGLWRYTRHPNYFGDACLWWGLYLIAAETAAGRWTIASPLFLTFILVKWSGAALLERRLKRSRPGYEDYLRRTSPFLPWPPKAGSDR